MFHRYFYARVKEKLGGNAGRNFVAITDPETQLAADAKRDNFRRSISESLPTSADATRRFPSSAWFRLPSWAAMSARCSIGPSA